MAKAKIGESHYVKNLRVLIGKIHNRSSVRDSFYEQATDYFLNVESVQEQRESLQQKLADAEQNPKDEKALKKVRKSLKSFDERQVNERIARHQQVLDFANEIIEMVEHADAEERQRSAARLLGSVMLMGSDEVKHRADSWNHHSQHVYKAVLALLLLNDLLKEEELTNPFLLQHFEGRIRSPKNLDEARACPFRNNIQIPLVMAVLLQDIGYYHPQALEILGDKPESPSSFSALSNEQKQHVRKIVFEQTVRFARYAIGTNKYVGNSKAERDEFEQTENDKLKFLLTLLTAAADPKQSIGNLLKVPQSYTSMVLSSKYPYATKPKVIEVLRKLAAGGNLNDKVVNAFVRIVGYFPVGFGITYIPKSSDGKDQEKYEYAIVTGLYPDPLDEPICRTATKNLTFTQFGHDLHIGRDNNLYFAEARAKLEKISRDRLLAILRKLVSNFDERKELDLIPKCWHPHTFFSYSQHQNLWNKKQLTDN